MIGFKVKALFFDSPAVLRRMDRKTRVALSKFGAFVRRRARSSIRKRKRTSELGQPPSSHVGTLRKLIYFSYDPKKKAVVIGPVIFEGAKNKGTPERLEKGGTLTIHAKGGKAHLAVYRARPFMQPAFDKELPNAGKLFAG